MVERSSEQRKELEELLKGILGKKYEFLLEAMPFSRLEEFVHQAEAAAVEAFVERAKKGIDEAYNLGSYEDWGTYNEGFESAREEISRILDKTLRELYPKKDEENK